MSNIIVKCKEFSNNICRVSRRSQYKVIAVLSLIDSFISVLPVEAAISAYSINSKVSRVFKMALLSSAVSLVGATCVYLISAYLSESIIAIIDNWGLEVNIETATAIFGEHGAILSIFFGTFAPFFPSIVAYHFAGLIKLNIFIFWAVVFVSRFLRLMIFGGGTYLYDVLILRHIKNIYVKWIFLFLFFVLIVLLFAQIKI